MHRTKHNTAARRRGDLTIGHYVPYVNEKSPWSAEREQRVFHLRAISQREGILFRRRYPYASAAIRLSNGNVGFGHNYKSAYIALLTGEKEGRELQHALIRFAIERVPT